MEQHVQHQFGAVASNYVSSTTHARGADLPVLVEAIEARGDEDALDLGTAVGHTAFAVAARVGRVVGIDLTAPMLDLARGLADERGVANAAFIRGDVTDLPFPNESFDVVTSRYSAHHYAHPEQVVREVARVLRPGGRFILADTMSPEVPALDTFVNTIELLRDRSHVRDYRVSEWQAMLGAAGLSSEVVFRWNVNLEFEDWVARIRTPSLAVAMLRQIFAEAPADARDTFHIAGSDPLTFSLVGVMLRARRQE